jgi:hypothetical protein
MRRVSASEVVRTHQSNVDFHSSTAFVNQSYLIPNLRLPSGRLVSYVRSAMGVRRSRVSSWVRLSSEMCTVKGVTFALLLMVDSCAMSVLSITWSFIVGGLVG